MPEHVCKNQNCGKTYSVSENDTDDGFCSFNCWEAVNCLEPEEINFEYAKEE